jgi:AraC family transcriptional regulator, regulatory protein of adaptative response / methylated-DNA-[protein]-cysteine methyltransferase
MEASTTKPKESARDRYADEEAKWRAIVQKDQDADGEFYYSVKTTGIYCRPSCPARLANRKNVAFYKSPEDAERAGFRACKRCNPRGPSLAEQHAAIIASACRAIKKAEDLPTLKEMAAAVGISPFYFHRLFKEATGLTPKSYAAAYRSDKMREELLKRGTVTEAIYEAGFNSNGRFYAKASGMLGMNPKNYQEGGTGTTIRFAIGECSLGSILVASSERGVCAISMDDDPDRLVKDLQDRFPRANLISGDHDFEKLVAKVVGFIEGPKIGLDLPLDVQGTPFQKRVWQALREIPAGATASYSEIANRIGLPKSIRAVAQACAANALAVAIPCHWVVRNDRHLSGYRWGVERKRALLEREGVAA